MPSAQSPQHLDVLHIMNTVLVVVVSGMQLYDCVRHHPPQRAVLEPNTVLVQINMSDSGTQV